MNHLCCTHDDLFGAKHLEEFSVSSKALAVFEKQICLSQAASTEGKKDNDNDTQRSPTSVNKGLALQA